MTYTIEHANDLLRTGRWMGPYASYGEAEAIVQARVARERSFSVYTIWQGTPQRPLKIVGGPFRGTQ